MTALTIESFIKLPSGAKIPRLGFGVYQSRGTECEQAVKTAITAGYRHIDSAQAYRNESIVGSSLLSTSPKVSRSQVFLTTKYMPTHQSHPSPNVYKEIAKSPARIDQLSDKGKEYVDLMLIHAPWGGVEGRGENWKALSKGQEDGWIRDIGVSNFGVNHLKSLPSPTPAINQIELHPWCQQKPIVAYCQQHNIAVQAYCPLVRAEPRRMKDPVLVRISEKYGKEGAQVLIRWSLQKGYIPLPKSVTPSRITSNADIYDFELSPEDMSALDGLDEGAKGACSWNPVDSD